MYHGHIRSIFPINYLASSLHIKTLSLLVMVLHTSTLTNVLQISLPNAQTNLCYFFLFGGGLREGWDSTYKRVLLHRIKHVTKSYKKKVR